MEGLSVFTILAMSDWVFSLTEEYIESYTTKSSVLLLNVDIAGYPMIPIGVQNLEGVSM